MSYLLEALKRLEEKRQGERVSDLLTVPAEVRREPKTRLLWLYVLSAALLANAGVALWWMAPWRTAIRPVSSQPSTGHREAGTFPAGTAVPAAVKAATDDKPIRPVARQLVEAPLKEKAVGRAPTQVLQAPVERQTRSRLDRQSTGSGAAAEAPPVTSGTSPHPQASLEAKPRADGKVLAVDELPAAVRNGLPELKVSLHSFSPEQRARLVRINDKTLGEGDVLSPGIRVEEITADGVVMSYEGYRFRVGVERAR